MTTTLPPRAGHEPPPAAAGAGADRITVDPFVAFHPPRSPLGRWLATSDARTWRSVRRALTLVCLVPLVTIAAAKANRFVGDPILGAYGVAVILSTVAVMYLAFVRYRDPSVGIALPEGELPLVSFFLPVKNEEENIEACVQSMLASTYPNLEVFVINDGSTDDTAAVLEQFHSDPRVTVISLETSIGKKKALVTAARQAKGSIFAFTDSDCIMAHDAIERCVAVLLDDKGLGAVCGHARALNADHNLMTRTQDVWYDGQFGINKAAESCFGSVSCVSGPLAVFRREAIYNYLPAWANDRFAGDEFLFATDRQLTAYVLGQRWIGHRLRAQYADDPFISAEHYRPRGWRIAYIKSARVVTNVPETSPSFLKQQIRWKKSFIRNLFFNGPYYWRRGTGPGMLFYGHAIWVVAAPIMAFRHLIWLPATGEWELMTLYLCGVATKGIVAAIAYKVQNPGCWRWVFRPIMSIASALVLSWLIVYSAFTIRKRVWHRA